MVDHVTQGVLKGAGLKLLVEINDEHRQTLFDRLESCHVASRLRLKS